MRRIVAVQAQLHRIAEWQLLECQAKERELSDRQQRLIEGLNGDDKPLALAAQTAARQLKAASIEHGVLAKAKEQQAAHALSEARKLKQALKMAEAVAKRALCEDEKRLLEAAIEKIAGLSPSAGSVDDRYPDH